MSQILGLQEYLDRKKPKEFLYVSENQEGYDSTEPCNLCLTFNKMLVLDTARRICFSGGGNQLNLGNVSGVKCSENASILGDVLTIVCRNLCSIKKHRVFTVIAR